SCCPPAAYQEPVGGGRHLHQHPVEACENRNPAGIVATNIQAGGIFGMVDDGRVEDVTQVRRAATRSRTTTDQRLKPSAAESGGLGPGEPPQAHQFGWGVRRADRPVPNLRDEGVSAVNSEAAKTAADRRFGL